MKPFDVVLNALHRGQNPYAGFPSGAWPSTWYNDSGAARPIFAECIKRLNPTLIIEVGSFVGESAIHMAKVLKEQSRDCAILCVDTWYAGFDHWRGARDKIQPRFGRPDLYEKFMANVIEHKCQDVIIPFPMDSIGAARVIKWLGLVPSLVYCDASHEEGDVLRDMNAYWDLLQSGGGLLCDDWTNWFKGVLADGERFIAQTGIQPVLIEGEKVLFIKP